MKRIAVVLVVTLIAVGAAGPAAAAPEPGPCTQSDVNAFFARGPMGFDDRVPPDHHFVDIHERCQFRLYSDGETFTFHDNEVFLGGIFGFWTEDEMDEFGITRREAIADLEEFWTTRVWLAPVLSDGSVGALVEQPLRESPYTNFNHLERGKLVYTHRAYVAQLPVGDYVLIYEETYHGETEGPATINLHIVPAAP